MNVMRTWLGIGCVLLSVLTGAAVISFFVTHSGSGAPASAAIGGSGLVAPAVQDLNSRFRTILDQAPTLCSGDSRPSSIDIVGGIVRVEKPHRDPEGVAKSTPEKLADILSPGAVLFLRTGGPAHWDVFVPTESSPWPLPESEEGVRAVVCLEDMSEVVGRYVDAKTGSPARGIPAVQSFVNARVVRLSDGRQFGEKRFAGAPPPEKISSDFRQLSDSVVSDPPEIQAGQWIVGLRAGGEISVDGSTYLIIANDKGGLCGPINVDGNEWPYAIGERGPLYPGQHLISCGKGAPVRIEIQEGTTFRLDGWSP